MKGPTRPAPSVPGMGVQRYSPVTNWNDDPFSADVFEPVPPYAQKKKPPPRPPPPKVPSKQPEVPLKPLNFIRRPTVLSALLSRKNKPPYNPNPQAHTQQLINEINNDLDTHKMFPKCEPKNIQMGALIDLSSPPSSPTFTTRSSSDGLSVDSFGSDATTSTNHHNVPSGGNSSQAESGFEDDFDLFLSSRKICTEDDTLDDFASVDPFSPQLQTVIKPPIMKKPELSKDLFDISVSQNAIPTMKGPTIIRVKPARPKPPDNSALLKNTFGGSFPVTSMNINTTAPIHKISNNLEVNFDSMCRPSLWGEGDGSRTPEREWSPPMPSVPPPPPPPELQAEAPLLTWPLEPAELAHDLTPPVADDEDPYAIAIFDYFTEHPDDLCFSRGSKVKLIRRVDEEWLYGQLRSGAEGLFPANYVEVKVGLANEPVPAPPRLGLGTALYDFAAVQPGDLPLRVGDALTVMYKLNDEWYYGECNGLKGQFPANYVQMS